MSIIYAQKSRQRHKDVDCLRPPACDKRPSRLAQRGTGHDGQRHRADRADRQGMESSCRRKHIEALVEPKQHKACHKQHGE